MSSTKRSLVSLGMVLATASAIYAEREAKDRSTSSTLPRSQSLGALPDAIASFGAAVHDEWLYVYGGHTGRKHEHSKNNVTGAFRRFNLRNETTWETLKGGTPLQSVALVAYGGDLYRVGGMTALNAPGEKEDMRSTDEFMRYDVRARKWTAMPPLPETRSSHDAVVLDHRLFIIGGWRLNGSADESTWHQNAWAFDLENQSGKWTALHDPPFKRRALALATAGGKVFALGGLTNEGVPSSAVFAYDPQTDSWSEHTSLPGYGFGASAFGVADDVYVAGRDGVLYRLTESEWENAGRLSVPRIFHRLVGDEKRLFVLGGANREGHCKEIEFLDLGGLAQGGLD